MSQNTQTIGEFVANDFRSATVFKKHNIDFCCKGHKTLDEVCAKKGIDKQQILDEISIEVSDRNTNGVDFKTWSANLLIDYIIENHHNYVSEKSIVLIQFLDKLCRVHGERHPELFEIFELFKGSAMDLAHHMEKEEMILFPFIKELEKAIKKGEAMPQPPFGTVNNPIAMMKHEHENEGDRFVKIAEITNNYTPPQDACNTYKVTFALLQEFENDLHTHIHLENNILFPKAQEMEKTLSN